MTPPRLPALLTLTFTLALGALAVEAARPPNVLLILVDDLKPLTAAYGDPLVQTPHLDRLAARGTRFNRAYCNQAVCGPSRYNLMLGSRSTSTGLYTFGRDFRDTLPDAVTLPQFFQQHGYHAESMGKVYHIGHQTYNDEASWSVPHHSELVIEYVDPASTPADGSLTREEAFFSNARGDTPNRELPRGAAWEQPNVTDEAYADGRIAARARARLSQLSLRDQPFFLAVGFARPHLPFSAPRRYWDLYDPATLPLATQRTVPRDAPPFAPKPPFGELNQYTPVPAAPPLDESTERTLVHGYYASVSYVDAQIGKVLDAVDELGLADDTLVVLWGDHGFSLGTHGLWTKHTNYEEANRIPLIFAGPGISRGAATGALAETVDIFPTLAALAGLPAPTGPQPIDGADQSPVLRDPASAVKDHVYHAFPRPRPGAPGEWLGRALRNERHRLVLWEPLGGPAAPPVYELYDYVADPAESVNVAAAQPEVVARLAAQLRAHGDPLPAAPRPRAQD